MKNWSGSPFHIMADENPSTASTALDWKILLSPLILGRPVLQLLFIIGD